MPISSEIFSFWEILGFERASVVSLMILAANVFIKGTVYLMRKKG